MRTSLAVRWALTMLVIVVIAGTSYTGFAAGETPQGDTQNSSLNGYPPPAYPAPSNSYYLPAVMVGYDKVSGIFLGNEKSMDHIILEKGGVVLAFAWGDNTGGDESMLYVLLRQPNGQFDTVAWFDSADINRYPTPWTYESEVGTVTMYRYDQVAYVSGRHRVWIELPGQWDLVYGKTPQPERYVVPFTTDPRNRVHTSVCATKSIYLAALWKSDYNGDTISIDTIDQQGNVSQTVIAPVNGVYPMFGEMQFSRIGNTITVTGRSLFCWNSAQ